MQTLSHPIPCLTDLTQGSKLTDLCNLRYFTVLTFQINITVHFLNRDAHIQVCVEKDLFYLFCFFIFPLWSIIFVNIIQIASSGMLFIYFCLDTQMFLLLALLYYCYFLTYVHLHTESLYKP